MSRRTGLGKGLDALIPSGDFTPQPETALPASAVAFVNPANISPNPRQPRAHIDPHELAELSASIRQHGLIQPLIVTAAGQSGQYILIAGERRLLAARQAGLSEVPVVVREANEQQLVELALVENVQRADLNPLEAAEAYRQLAEDFHLSHEEISTRVGKSRVTITNTLRLLKLPASAKQALAQGRISEGHARVLLSLPTLEAQDSALQIILQRDLSVRQAEELVRNLIRPASSPRPRPSPPPEIKALEDRLRDELGTKVVVNHRSKGGTLVIHYYSEEELNNLVDHLLNVK
jgi:ParB family transcriptional regulator, chromosome partitioning protein